MFETLMLSAVENLLSIVVEGYLREKILPGRTRFDFFFKDKSGNRVAIELKNTLPSNNMIRKMAHWVGKVADEIDKFILLTPDSPTEKKIEEFQRVYQEIPVESTWLGINELPIFLGVTEPIDLKSTETISDLHATAFISNIEKYRKPSLHIRPVIRLTSAIEFAKEELEKIPWEFRQLGRQFSPKHINDFLKKNKPLDKLLKVGMEAEDIIIVLSDIVNFSKLIKAARPRDVKDIMYRYYKMARELVWKYGGVLDKFIGDAVLAVFNYPFPDKQASTSAIQFSADLIELGRKLFMEEFSDLINDDIKSGTRVGISSGDVIVLDIGKDGNEISFVGDPINLAARLESKSKVNAILISNTTRSMLYRNDRRFYNNLNLRENKKRLIDAKGQRNRVKAWPIDKAIVQNIAQNNR